MDSTITFAKQHFKHLPARFDKKQEEFQYSMSRSVRSSLSEYHRVLNVFVKWLKNPEEDNFVYFHRIGIGVEYDYTILLEI